MTVNNETPAAELAGYLTAEISQLHGLHPEAVFGALLRAAQALGIRFSYEGTEAATSGMSEPRLN